MGWFYIGINTIGECDFGIFKTLTELWQANNKDTLILVDIPIGLPSKTNPSRECDSMARKQLSPLRHNSVFTPPCREVLSAKSYEDACQLNKALLGKKISIMAWGISTKIREADKLLKENPKARDNIRESHPEVCFSMLNRGNPMDFYKKKTEGQAERLELLQGLFDISRAIFKAAKDRFLRKEVAEDDIVDALALAVTGYLSSGDLATLPEKPLSDERGLPMEMVYFKPKKEGAAIGAKSGVETSGVISEMLGRCGTPNQTFPATELYNETWMLRLVVDWFSRNKVPDNPLNFSKDCRWFSEGQIPTQFQPTSRKDKLGEAWTHADCVIGHFEVGHTGKTDIQLSKNASHLVCIEAKIFSKLSPGVSNARYYNQAARYVACMAEMLYRANQRKPADFNNLRIRGRTELNV